MSSPARGNAIQIGYRAERDRTVPPAIGTGFEWLNPQLPASFPLVRAEVEPGQVNRSGFTEPSIPGYVTGDGTTIAHPLTVPHLLPLLQHILRSSVANGTLVKTELEAGTVWQYEYTPDPNGVDQSQEWMVVYDPVERYLKRGVKWSRMQLAITAAGGIPVTLSGFTSHESRLGPSTPEGTNTGAYALGPHLRGPLEDRTVGKVWVQVTAVGPPLTFKVIAQAGLPDAPTWTAATEYTVETDPLTGEGVWQIALGATGLDLGHVTSEVFDPLEIVWPGLDADRSTAAVGDTWSFEIDWPPPAATYLPSLGKRMGMGHWRSYARDLGAGVWEAFQLQQMTHVLAWPLTARNGSGTLYYTDIFRDGLLAPTFACQRDWVDSWILDRVEARKRFELRQVLEGVQLGTGQYRESLAIECPSVGIRTRATDTGQAGVIPESFDLTGETDGSGSSPVTITCITDRDWTPAS